MKYYFRGELQQIENLPQAGLIVAMNHAGCFPGTLGLAYLLGKTRGWVVQPLAGVAV